MLLKMCTIADSPSGHVIAQTLSIQSVHYKVILNCVFCKTLASMPSICSKYSQKHTKTFRANLYYQLEIGHKGIKIKSR